MRIVCLNGSPKGERSMTIQGVRLLCKRLPEHEFSVLHVGQHINHLAQSASALDAILLELQQADAIIWFFPVYFNLVPSQLKQFIELLFARETREILHGKYATAISTSAHFYDDLAHEYLHAVSEDLQLRYVTGFSAGASYLLTSEDRADVVGFVKHFLFAAAAGIDLPRTHPELPSVALYRAEVGTKQLIASSGPSVRILADLEPHDLNLRHMIDVFVAQAPGPVEVLALQDLGIRGGCLGCMRCAQAGLCVYTDSFGASGIRVAQAETIIWAGTIRDRYLSALFKTFLDRQFVNGHRPNMSSKRIGFLVSGPLRHLPSLCRNLEAYAQVSRAELLGFASDDYASEDETTASIRSLARQVDRPVEAGWKRPSTFLGVGGHKVFRDLVYENRAMMQADARYYRRHGLYDFPTTGVRQHLRNLLLSILVRLSGADPRHLLARLLDRYRRAAEASL